MRALDVATSHLDTLSKLSDALDNGDVRAVNYLSNEWKQQTGQEAPTDFASMKPIVAGEIVKATTGANGALGDRNAIQEQINGLSASHDQIKGAINTYKTAMTGQLGGLQQQYENSTGRKDFLTRLRPETRNAISPASQPPTSNSGGAFQPRQLFLNGKVATASSPADLQEMQALGWK